jgi:glycine/D-amino acid oxidase-like deaminating enzyme
MINKADVIVIGSGALGAATAYYLTKRKGLGVALIDKHDIGSQTSPRYFTRSSSIHHFRRSRTLPSSHRRLRQWQ